MYKGNYTITTLTGKQMTVQVTPIYIGIKGEFVCVGCEINDKVRTLEQFMNLKPIKL